MAGFRRTRSFFALNNIKSCRHCGFSSKVKAALLRLFAFVPWLSIRAKVYSLCFPAQKILYFVA